jgi:hypothetical protein
VHEACPVSISQFPRPHPPEQPDLDSTTAKTKAPVVAGVLEPDALPVTPAPQSQNEENVDMHNAATPADSEC